MLCHHSVFPSSPFLLGCNDLTRWARAPCNKADTSSIFRHQLCLAASIVTRCHLATGGISSFSAVSQILCKFAPSAVQLRANRQFTHNSTYCLVFSMRHQLNETRNAIAHCTLDGRGDFAWSIVWSIDNHHCESIISSVLPDLSLENNQWFAL